MSHDHRPSTKSAISLAFWLNLVFSIIEIIGGLYTNSTAIIADALHDFMDAVAIGTAVILEKIAGKKRTPHFTYGYKRFSLLAAVGMSGLLLAGAIIMISSAIQSFIHPKEVNSMGMLWLAILGIAINGFAFWRIKKGDAHQHAGHAHSQHHNSRAIMLHLLEDVLGWIAVLIGAIVIYFTAWYWIDGVLAIGIAIFVGYNAIKNLISAMKVMLQAVPEGLTVEAFSAAILEVEGVDSIHDLHLWSMDGEYHVGSMHVVLMNTYEDQEDTIILALHEVMKKFNISHPTIQLEKKGYPCALAEC